MGSGVIHCCIGRGSGERCHSLLQIPIQLLNCPDIAQILGMSHQLIVSSAFTITSAGKRVTLCPMGRTQTC